MKITVATPELKTALARLSSIPGANGASIHTQIVTMTADVAGLTLMRFTSEAQISVTIDDSIQIHDDSGDARVAHGRFVELVNSCHAKEVEIFTDETNLHVTSGKTKSKLRTLDADILTDPPEGEDGMKEVTVLVEDLAEVLSFTGAAASRDTAGSYCFCGVAVRMIDGELFFLATDKRRLLAQKTDWQLPVDCVIPSEGVDAILKAIGNMTGGCTFAIGETFVKIVSDRLEVSVTLLSEKYPDSVQKMILNSSIESKIHVNRDEFIGALKACAAVAEDESRSVKLDVRKKLLTVSGMNKDTQTETPVDCRADKEESFGVPGKHVADGLSKLDAAEDGGIQLRKHLGALSAVSDDRMAFFVVAKPQT